MVYESEYDLSDFNGNMVIEYKVKGFWNRGALTIFIKRGYTSDPSGYSFTIVAGGGRDTKEVESDAEAYRYFAEALVAAADLVDDLKENHIMTLEDNYQEYYRRVAAEREAAALARHNAIENDTKVGRDLAKLTVERLKLQAKERPWVHARLEYRPRGEEYTREIAALFHERKTTFEHEERRISSKDLVDVLAFAAEIIEPNKKLKVA